MNPDMNRNSDLWGELINEQEDVTDCPSVLIKEENEYVSYKQRDGRLAKRRSQYFTECVSNEVITRENYHIPKKIKSMMMDDPKRSLSSFKQKNDPQDITSNKPTDINRSGAVSRNSESLIFQLGCIGSFPTDFSQMSQSHADDEGDSLIFPKLTAVVSDAPSCSNMGTTASSGSAKDLAVTDNGDGQQYGWFVDADIDRDDEARQAILEGATEKEAKQGPLAFKAPETPLTVKRLDTQVEWAQAADIVDDVLGDFF